jgi:Gpi18-like mannosyltransferase
MDAAGTTGEAAAAAPNSGQPGGSRTGAAALPRVGITIALAIAAYGAFWPAQTFDMQEFLYPWLEHIEAEGPVGAFAHPFSNYTPAYLYLLALASPLLAIFHKISIIKGISVLGTLWLAWGANRIFQASGAASGPRAAALILLLPTVLLNAAFLGQCDALWAAPCLLAVACAIERKPAAMLVWCGIAFSIKAQAVFIAPFAIAVLISQRAPLRQWLIPPAVYAAMMAPAWMAGWPAKDLATVYLRQAQYFDDLSMNAPNVWLIAQQLPGALSLPLSLAAFAAAGAASIAFIARFGRSMRQPEIIEAALLSALILPGLLPRMHDRYFFLADVLALVLALRRRDRSSCLILAAVQTGSILALWSYLISDPRPATVGALLMIAATIAVAARLLAPFPVPQMRYAASRS